MKRGLLACVVCASLFGCAEDPDAGASSSSGSEAGDASMSATSNPSDTSAEGESSSGMMSGCETGPLPAPIAGCTPTPMTPSGDFGQDCVDRINQFRWECQCLPPLARWADAEMCTDTQSENDHNAQVPHGNFQACGEWAQNTCPDWPSEEQVINGCLQAMWDEGPGEPFEAHGHYINMSSTDYSKVACGRFDSGQGVWSNQNFSP
jgi:hypothetical protein